MGQEIPHGPAEIGQLSALPSLQNERHYGFTYFFKSFGPTSAP